MHKHVVPVRVSLYFNMNTVIRFLILSDMVFIGSLGLIGPIFALFVVDVVEGGNAAVAGSAAAVFLITKGILQIPIASFIDRIRGEKDDFWLLFFGTIVAAVIPLFYLLISTPGHLYLVQFFYGLAVAVTVPSYMAIYTRHIDKNKVGTEWGIYFTLTNFMSALTAALGGILADTIGFRPLIVVVVCLSMAAALAILPIRPYMKTPSHSQK